MSKIIILFFAAALFTVESCGQIDGSPPDAPRQSTAAAQTDPCDNPDAPIGCCFVNMPERLTPIMAIADSAEKGTRIIIKGQLLQTDGQTPYRGVILYAYQTDANGYYSKTGREKGVQKWHGRLHGWCISGANGEYEIHTIRPARYPSNTIPAHIHAAVKEPGGEMYYLNDYVFADDDLINERYLSRLRDSGDNGVITLQPNTEGILEGQRITPLVQKTPARRY